MITLTLHDQRTNTDVSFLATFDFQTEQGSAVYANLPRMRKRLPGTTNVFWQGGSPTLYFSPGQRIWGFRKAGGREHPGEGSQLYTGLVKATLITSLLQKVAKVKELRGM